MKQSWLRTTTAKIHIAHEPQLTLFETGPQHLFPTMQTLHISSTREVTGNRPPVLRRVGLHDAAKLRIFLGSPFGCGRTPFGFTWRPATANQRPLAPGSHRQGSGGSCQCRSVGDARRTARQHWEVRSIPKSVSYWLFGACMILNRHRLLRMSMMPKIARGWANAPFFEFLCSV